MLALFAVDRRSFLLLVRQKHLQWTTNPSADTRSNEEEAVARIAANHLRQLQQMQRSAASNPREVEAAHIALCSIHFLTVLALSLSL